jgi:membrane protease YdiL (CAAX protease family)
MSFGSALLLLVLIMLPVLSSRSLRGQADIVRHQKISFYLVGMAIQWILTIACFFVIRDDSLPPADIGLRLSHPLKITLTIGLGVTTALVVLTALIFWLQLARGWRESDVLTAILPETGREKLLFVALAGTAGFCEETLYRGFAITRLAIITGGLWSAAIVAVVIFSAGHVYQGTVGVLRAGVLGAVLAATFVLTGSLVPGMIAHFLLDTLAGFFGRKLLRRIVVSGQ